MAQKYVISKQPIMEGRTVVEACNIMEINKNNIVLSVSKDNCQRWCA